MVLGVEQLYWLGFCRVKRLCLNHTARQSKYARGSTFTAKLLPRLKVTPITHRLYLSVPATYEFRDDGSNTWPLGPPGCY